MVIVVIMIVVVIVMVVRGGGVVVSLLSAVVVGVEDGHAGGAFHAPSWRPVGEGRAHRRTSSAFVVILITKSLPFALSWGINQ